MHICRLVAAIANTSITLHCVFVICAFMCPLHLEQNPFFWFHIFKRLGWSLLSPGMWSQVLCQICVSMSKEYAVCLSLGWKNDKVEAVFMFTNKGTTTLKLYRVIEPYELPTHLCFVISSYWFLYMNLNDFLHRVVFSFWVKDLINHGDESCHNLILHMI